MILSGAPFSIYTQVLATYIDGVKQFDRSIKRDWTYQAGGFAMTDLNRLPAIIPVSKPLAAVKLPDAAALDDPMKPARTLAIRVGRIHTSAGEPIVDGVIVIENGTIKAIGPANAVVIPKGVPVVVAAEATPGLIDVHSVCGLSGAYNIAADQDQDESSDPNQAELRVIDGFNPNDPHLEFLRANGVTIVQAMPGRGCIIAGQTGIFHTAGTTVSQSMIRFPSGLLVNLGESPKGHSPKSPSTRMGTAGLLRTALNQAKDYLVKKDRARNLKNEALEPFLQGKLPVIFSAHRADDMMTGLRLAEEFKLRPVLSLATEAYLIPEAIIASKAPVYVHPTLQRAGSSMETLHGFTGNAAFLADHKVPMAICTAFEGYVPKTRILRSEAAMAMTNGLGHDRALKAVTIDAATLLGLDKEYGSLEAGKIADVVLYDGDPLENTSHVVLTIVGGRVVYSRADYLKLPFERRIMALVTGQNCCMGE